MENEKGKVLLSAKELKEILGCNNNTLYEDFLAWAREQAKKKAIGDSGPRFSVSKRTKKI